MRITGAPFLDGGEFSVLTEPLVPGPAGQMP